MQHFKKNQRISEPRTVKLSFCENTRGSALAGPLSAGTPRGSSFLMLFDLTKDSMMSARCVCVCARQCTWGAIYTSGKGKEGKKRGKEEGRRA